MTPPTLARRARPSRRSAASVIALVMMTALVGCGSSEPEPFSGFVRTPTPSVADVSLPAVESDGSETPFRFEADEGELLLVYFGYTSCPDVCPTTLADVRRALEEIGDDAGRIDLAMVTIDVDVDTPEVLTTYVRSFVPDSIAIRSTDDSRLRAAADVFGADYGKETVDGRESVYHTGSLYVVDDHGELLLTWPFGTAAGDIQSDMERLLDGESVA